MEQRLLIRRVLAGDPAAARAFYDRHVERVYRLVYRLSGDEELARDFTQETFIRAFQWLGRFRGEAALSTWLHAIAVSVTLNGLRKFRRQRDHEVELEEARHRSAPSSIVEPDLRERLERAVAGLPEIYRVAFILHDVEGYTHREIGALLGVPPGTPKARLSRARTLLRKALSAYAEEYAS